MSQTELTQPQKIAHLNDMFRKNLPFYSLMGQVVTTSSISLLPQNDKNRIYKRVMEYKDFNEKVDPHGERDFGTFKQNADTIFWKIDYYDKNMKYGSENPADTKTTKRILTIMYDYEY